MDINPNYKYAKRNENELEVNSAVEEKVGLIKSFPGICEELIDYHIDKGYKGLVIEGTGLGHVPDKLIAPLARAHDENIPVVMTSQCLYGILDKPLIAYVQGTCCLIKNQYLRVCIESPSD